MHPFRIRTVTAFLHLSDDPSKWEVEVAAAGAFLAQAQQHLESLGTGLSPHIFGTQYTMIWRLHVLTICCV